MKKNIIKLLFASLVGVIALSSLSFDSSLQAAEVDTLDVSTINTDGLKVDKTSKANADGTYTIDLESYTTGSVSIVEKAQPLDIVMVMDQSGSMGRLIDTGNGTKETINKSLIRTALAFLDSLNINATESNVDHRVAAVGFSNYYWGTGILGKGNADGTKSGHQYKDLAANEKLYANQMLSITSAHEELSAAISNMQITEDTRTDLGYEMAYKLLEHNQTTETNRQKVVIVFTDGEPTTGFGLSSEKRFDASIEKAYTIKNEHNALVYSIASIDPYEGSKIRDSIIKFMNYASSNYKNATSIINPGEDGDESKGFYKSADTTPAMDEIFKQIFEQITKPNIALDSTTTMKDVISPYFQEATAENIKVYTQNYAGKDAAGNDVWGDKVLASDSITAKIEGKSVLVSGFDYNANTITWSNNVASGKKLVVEITVNKKDGFIGGIGVETNDASSGIYINDTLIKEFPKPTVDVPFEINATANNDSIYLGGKINSLEYLLDADVNKEGVQYKIGDKVYNFGENNNDYVDVYYTIKDEDGSVKATYKIPAGASTGIWFHNTLDIETTKLTENKNYTVEVSITNKGAEDVVKSDAKTSTIFVFKPEIRVTNQLKFLNENINLNDVVGKEVTWTNSDPNAPALTTLAPKLTYTYDVVTGTAITDSEDYKPLEDGTYKVSVFNDNTNITSNTKITNTDETEIPTEYNFKIRVVDGALKIEKFIDKGYTENKAIKANQTFVFRIDVRDEIDGEITKTMYQSIDFSANENTLTKSVVLQHLPKGYYTVSEESNWSWKYVEDVGLRMDNYKGNVEIAKNIFIGDADAINSGGFPYYGTSKGTDLNGVDIGNQAEVIFTNTIKLTNIVGDTASAINKFTGK